MAVTAKSIPNKFAIQQVFEILIRTTTDRSIYAFLTDIKTSGLENTLEMVYPTGSRGNVYVGRGFAHSRRARLNVTSATWNTEVVAIQNGTDVEKNIKQVTYYDVIEVEGTTLNTKFTALGLTGAEIRFLYKLSEDGTYDAMYEQAATATTGKFSYSPTTKLITLDTADAPMQGDRYACAYEFKPLESERISVKSDAMPSLVYITAFGIAQDSCNGELFPAQIEGMAQIDGNWTFDLAADGEPAVQNLNMEFVKGCSSKDLYTFTVFTEDEA